jgi:hypothetical protein
MNENNVALVGTPVNLTIFVVDYEYSKPPRKEKLPRSAKREAEKVKNRVIVTSGDPTGEDVFKIARWLVLGSNPYEGNDFRILNQQRMVDAMGLASVTSWDKLSGHAPESLDSNLVEVEDEEEGSSAPSDPNLN